MPEALRQGRLRWRCRRGTRELDALLSWFLDARFEQSEVDAQEGFARVLEAEDPDVWDWCMGRRSAPDGAMQSVIDAIRARHCV